MHAFGLAGPDVDSVEVSPQSAAAAADLGRRVAASGGAALIVDYGSDSPATDSLRRAPSSRPAARMLAFLGVI